MIGHVMRGSEVQCTEECAFYLEKAWTDLAFGRICDAQTANYLERAWAGPNLPFQTVTV